MIFNDLSKTELESRLRAELNPPQYEAVTHTGSPLLVLAGAGSGKTRVITYRIAYLMAVEGLSPWNILAVTFTNKAAKEMRDRVSKLTGGAMRGTWIGTFHSICTRILRQDGKIDGIDPNFSIYDRADQTTAVKQAKSKCNLGDDKILKPNSVLNAISRAKNMFLWPQKYQEQANSLYEENIAKIYKEYQTILRNNNALDFDDLIMNTVRLLVQYKDVGDVYRKRFKHIMVDEYQDTNHPQYLFIKELAKEHHQICAVGDDDQSIYRWRGANVENILNFEKDYPSIHTVKLEQNYRSTKNILSAASSVIQINSYRHEKKLWTDNTDGDKAGIVNLPDEESEAFWIVEKIQKLHNDDKVPLGDIAVFYRINAQSRLFEEECIRRSLAYSLVGSTAFYQRKEIKDVMSYARLMINPADYASFERIINIPKRKLGKVSLQKLVDFAERAKLPILEAALKAQEAGEGSGLALATRKAFHQFASLYQRWADEANDISLVKLFDHITRQSGYMKVLEDSMDIQDQTRIENIKELINAAGQYEDEIEANQGEETAAPTTTLLTLQGFMENAALVSEVDNLKDSDDALVLMTIHSAKGLEFPYVFMAGMEENLFPHKRSVESDALEDMEEERRLCYVGITRAKKQVYLTHACSRRLYQFREVAEPSRFLKEIPDQFKETINWSTFKDDSEEGELLQSSRKAARKNLETNFTENDCVTHRTFGLGVIIEIDGEGPKAHITVDFQSVGKKTLVQQFARLTKV